VLAGALASAMVLAGCGSTADQTTDAGAGAGGVKTDKGVTDTTITLGIMGDNTGPFKNLGAGLNAGNQLWVDDVNAAGGICDRQLALEVVDHGYKADTPRPSTRSSSRRCSAWCSCWARRCWPALKQNLIDDTCSPRRRRGPARCSTTRAS
jgi:hypothetical protein